MTGFPEKLANAIVTYSKPIILVMLVLTVVMALGMPMVDSDSDTEQFESDSPAVAAQEYIDANFTEIDAEEDQQMIVQAIQRADEDGNALSQESLVASLEFQLKLLENETVSATLHSENPVFGIANVLADAAMDGEGEGSAADTTANESAAADNGADGDANDTPGTLSDDEKRQAHIDRIERQKATLAGLDEDELDSLIAATLTEEAGVGVLGLLPESYEPGSTSAIAHILVITQQVGPGEAGEMGEGNQAAMDAQLVIQSMALAEDQRYAVFGTGIIFDEIDRSLGESFAIVGPLALLFVFLALTVAYRDPLDIILGLFGVVAVLIWVFGFMGWTGIAFNQMLIAVPVLLIGLSIDYAIHVFMRHREQLAAEQNGNDLRRSMAIALAGVGVALIWVTVTAAIGFLANLVSPIGPLQDFGLTAAFGVFAALAIFGTLVPALKVELDGLLRRVGFTRQKRAFGTGETIISRLLSGGAAAARRAPVIIVALALVVTLVGAIGATGIETSFQEEDFLADSPPGWTQYLPEPFAPGEYHVKDDLDFIQQHFQPEGSQGALLIRGNVTWDDTLVVVQNGSEQLGEKDTVFELPTGEADIQAPLTMARTTAAENETFAVELDGADTTGDGVPDENLAKLYDDLLAANPAATEVIHRTPDGEYRAIQLVVEIRGDADMGETASDLREVADDMEAASDGELAVDATGQAVIFTDIESDLMDTVLQGLVLTLVAVILFVILAYPLAGKPATLGVVTMLPIVLAVAWILGSMALLDVPFNILTGTISSLTIGLGIAYTIHVSARYELELERQRNVWKAMETTLSGTGGALLGSAATTVGAFGTLAVAIFPLLQQFGIITGLTIIYAFLASVLVLPSLLVLWTKYFGPAEYLSGAGQSAEESTDQPEAESTSDFDD